LISLNRILAICCLAIRYLPDMNRISTAVLILLIAGCVEIDDADSDHVATLNEIAILGSHNSYKREIPREFYTFLEQRSASAARAINYSHYSIASQLDGGLRQLEIDVVADSEGGLFEKPFAATYLEAQGVDVGEQQGFYQSALRRPGFKVLHIPDIDIFTHCATFEGCLGEIYAWSNAHKNHLPIFILINAKESGAGAVDGVLPIRFNPELYDELDKAITAVVPRHKLIVPDDIRGEADSLKQAVTTTGWPTIDESLGKLVFIFDGSGSQADVYRTNHKSLRDRIMFAAYEESQDEAAIMVINDPLSEQARIQNLVKQGFIVRTRSDAGLNETPMEMRQRFEAARSSGAQIISSDFYRGSPNAQRIGYEVWLD